MNRPVTAGIALALLVAGFVLAPVALSSSVLAQSTDTGTATEASTPSDTPTDTPAATATPASTATATPEPTATATSSPTETTTPSPTGTSTDSTSPAGTATATATSTGTATTTDTPTATATDTATPMPTATATSPPSDSDGSVDGCTVVTEPGHYELVGDVGHDDNETCIEIRADDVVLDGDGHAIEGPGPNAFDDTYRGIYLNWSDNVTVRDVEVTGWSPGVRSVGSGNTNRSVTLEDVTVRDSDDGIVLLETGTTVLRGVTAEDNDGFGVDTDRIGTVRGYDVTLRDNERGLGTWDSHGIHLESSRIVDNDDNGINLHHHSSLILRDVEVSGNGEDGINAFSSGGFHVSMTMTGGTVDDNGEDGVAAVGNADLSLSDTTVAGNGRYGIVASGGTVAATDVTVRDNADMEVNGFSGVSGPGGPEGDVTGDELAVGDSARTTFENESIGLEPVERSSLPPLPGDASTVGDGLNVSGPVDGPVELVLDVDADGEDVELWRHDGSEWETAEENPAVGGGTLQASVGQNGTYAPVVTGDSSDNDGGGSSDNGDSGSADNGGSSDNSGSSGSDGSASTETAATGTTDTPSATSTAEATATTEPTTTATTDADQEAQNTDGDSTAEGNDGQVTINGENEDDLGTADGAGFTGVVGLLALLGGALLVRRRG